jgi:hypothetical protein
LERSAAVPRDTAWESHTHLSSTNRPINPTHRSALITNPPSEHRLPRGCNCLGGPSSHVHGKAVARHFEVEPWCMVKSFHLRSPIHSHTHTRPTHHGVCMAGGCEATEVTHLCSSTSSGWMNLADHPVTSAGLSTSSITQSRTPQSHSVIKIKVKSVDTVKQC